MEFIDTHAHLYVKAFAADRELMIERAHANGVSTFYLPNIDQESIPDLLALEARFPETCMAMMGLHPCSVKEDYETALAEVRSWLERRPFAAVGEIGLDLYWDKTFVREQEDAFLRQCAWAREFNLPIVIHSRESTAELIALLRKEPKGTLSGIFHCFTGTLTQAQEIIDLGFYLGIGGVLTFKNGGLDQVVSEISLDYLVLETDAPYLAPVPHRGKRNESAYVRLVAEKLAEIKKCTLEEVAAVTTANARNVFPGYDLAEKHANQQGVSKN
ncbi:MAG: TatD family hydrolase [Lewinellaceae bacterium]|nr:TatD family hydrolase [Lewinellaceae bacterium]